MFTALTSLIWGTEEQNQTEKTNIQLSDQVELENEWIYINKDFSERLKKQVHFHDDGASTTSESADSINNGMEESWIVTPPQCFNNKRKGKAEMNPMENLLIEHPSMSIYHERDEDVGDENQQTEVATRHETHRSVAGRNLQLKVRVPLKDVNGKTNDRKSSGSKGLKRKNMVFVRSNNSRKNKQYGRMTGKHVGMVGKRGT